MATAAVAAVGSGRPACSRRPAPRRPTSRGITAPRQHATSVQRPCGRSRAKGEGEQWTELGVHQEDDWDEDEDVGSDDDVGADPEAHQRLLASQDAGPQRETLSDTLGWRLQTFQPLRPSQGVFPAGADAPAPGGGEPGPAPMASREQQEARLQGVLGEAAQRRQFLEVPEDQQFIPPWQKMRYMMPAPAPQLTEWDLRAKMEKRRRQLQEEREWNERRAAVGRYPQAAADWRSDVRCGDTGNPTDPAYREWSQAEIWDLITNGGRSADPRDVELRVYNPLELVADAPAQGATYNLTPEEWFAAEGRLIADEDVEAIAASAGEKDEEAALLAAEFDDFDEQLGGQLGGAFDDGFGGGGGGGARGGGGDDDDGF